eukprot:961091-Rhodomonas_salina.1
MDLSPAADRVEQHTLGVFAELVPCKISRGGVLPTLGRLRLYLGIGEMQRIDAAEHANPTMQTNRGNNEYSVPWSDIAACLSQSPAITWKSKKILVEGTEAT